MNVPSKVIGVRIVLPTILLLGSVAGTASAAADGQAVAQLAQYHPAYHYPPPPAPYTYGRPPCNVAGGAFRGAARGAAGGAVFGAIAGNAGTGAAIGAAIGGLGGAARRASAGSYGYCY
jgi:hypothetical protein